MLLRDLASAAERLEATKSRRTLVEIVATLLARAGAEDREPLVFLLQAQLRPPYEGVEVGVGEKLLMQAIASAYDVGLTAVERRYAKLGDLGLVAQAFATGRAKRGATVRQAYDALLTVARTSGSGSIGKKTGLVAQLLKKSTGLEAKFLVRVAQGRLRLGVGDQTIVEAAAVAALGDGRKKPALERAYNVRSDLSGVVSLAFAKGVRALESITPQVGVPVRPELAQRLPSARAIIDRLGEVQAEPKYDGFRLQLHRNGRTVWAFSRRLENVTGMFPDLVEGMRRQLKAKRAIIEGEAVVYNPDTGDFLPFQVTMTRKRKEGITEAAERYPLRLFAFDVLSVGNESYLPLSQRERSARLRKLVPFGPDDAIAVTEARLIKEPAALARCFDEMIEHGLEGIVAKRPDAPYRAGARGYDWVKLKRAYQSKLRDTVDLVLVGYMRGRGKRAAFGIGSLLGAVYDPAGDRYRTVAKIGSGLSDSAWRALKTKLDATATKTRPRNVDSRITPDVWVTPKYVVEVLADEITRSPFHTAGRQDDQPGYALRFPRMLQLRADKGPTDATTEKEIVDMLALQGRKGKKNARSRRRAATAKGKAS